MLAEILEEVVQVGAQLNERKTEVMKIGTQKLGCT